MENQSEKAAVVGPEGQPFSSVFKGIRASETESLVKANQALIKSSVSPSAMKEAGRGGSNRAFLSDELTKLASDPVKLGLIYLASYWLDENIGSVDGSISDALGQRFGLTSLDAMIAFMLHADRSDSTSGRGA